MLCTEKMNPTEPFLANGGSAYDMIFDSKMRKGDLTCLPSNSACKDKICKCNVRLMEDMTIVFNDLLQVNPTVALNYINDAGVCKTPGTGGSSDDTSCCGEAPTWYPYKTHSGTRSCCDTKLYDIVTKQCCNDGRIINFNENC